MQIYYIFSKYQVNLHHKKHPLKKKQDVIIITPMTDLGLTYNFPI